MTGRRSGRTLLVTNDFPPRQGGIQSFVHALAVRQPAGSLVVLTSSYDGAARFDAEQPFPVVRAATSMLLPTPSAARQAVDLVRGYGCRSVWFGAAAPLALLAPVLRRAGVRRVVAQTHGHEAAWARLPVGRQLLRRIGSAADVVTYLGDYTRRRIAGPLGRHPELIHLPPGVDPQLFSPGADGTPVRTGCGLGGRPTVVCVSRLVPRKGQDMLIRALPEIGRRVPGAVLLVVGGGPDAPRLQRIAVAAGVADDVVFTGPVASAELPAYFAAGQVFAMPCRTRRGGLDVEGLGMVYLEASAAGLPVVAGSSGGAPDAVLDGETGYVVDGRSTGQIVDRVAQLLSDVDSGRAMGEKGRSWVEREWRWDTLAARLTALLRD